MTHGKNNPSQTSCLLYWGICGDTPCPSARTETETSKMVSKTCFFPTTVTFSASLFGFCTMFKLFVAFSVMSLKFLLCPIWGNSVESPRLGATRTGTLQRWESQAWINAPSPLCFCYSCLSTFPPCACLPHLSLHFHLFCLWLLLFSVCRPQNRKPCRAHIGTRTHIWQQETHKHIHAHAHAHMYSRAWAWYTWTRGWRLWCTLANVGGRLGWFTSSPNDYFMSGWEEEQRGGGVAALLSALALLFQPFFK